MKKFEPSGKARWSCAEKMVTLVLAFALFALPLDVWAQPGPKVPRIGVLVPAEPSPKDPSIEAFTQALHRLGHLDGRTAAIEWRYAHGRTERFEALIAELVQLNVDVLVVGSTAGAKAAVQVTQTVPIVFVGAVDPVGGGLVASLARPGGNVTGLSFAYEDGMGGKLVGLLKELVPKASHIASLGDATYTGSRQVRHDITSAAQRLGRFTLVLARGPDDLDRAFAAVVKAGAVAVLVEPVPFFHTHHHQVVAHAARHRLPAIYGFRVFVDAGGLMSYGVALPDLWRRAGPYVDKILKGAKPGELPVEQPTNFELAINMKTAKALGLTIPPTLLRRADHVIE